jgi:hypothetical protein
VAKARELGWPVAERMSHHLALLTDAALIAESLCDLISPMIMGCGSTRPGDPWFRRSW